MHRATAIILVLLSACPTVGRAADDPRADRQGKIDLIVQFQDKRTIYDGKLVSFLTDPDPVVRQRAVRAFGSIQDTSVINLLVDRLSTDASENVSSEAAFAIGQTAGALSRNGREALEHDLIWTRLERMPAGGSDQLIEELGKWCSVLSLQDLVLKYGNASPPDHLPALTMCIARCAIRNVTAPEAVRLLLSHIKPYEATTWQTAYALQRVGNHDEIRADLEQVVELYRHPDPLVRMNIATLLGKVKDETRSLEALLRLADFDPDWRVRVNALKALAAFDLERHPDAMKMFRRLFTSGPMYVSLTALSAFGSLVLRDTLPTSPTGEALRELERIALNRGNELLWQFQAEAASSLSRLRGAAAMPFIDLRENTPRALRTQLLASLGRTAAPTALPMLLSYARGDEPVLARAALDGLAELWAHIPHDTLTSQTLRQAGVEGLRSGDVALVTTAASLLGDSTLLDRSSVMPLIEALNRARLPHDIEAMQEICATLGRLRDERALEPLRQQLEQKDRSVASAASAAIKAITGHSEGADVPSYFEPLYTDYDFNYLHALRDSICGRGRSDTICVNIETIRGNIVAELYLNYAPMTIMSVLKLATQRGFYRGLTFHRIVPNFVIQGGDPRGDGWGGPGYTIRSEFSPLRYETGTVGIASAGKDTEGSQFFITQSPQPHLDGRYTIIGRVKSGMEVVNALELDDHLFDIKLMP
jgi:peptidylprolyl isomerase